MVNLGPGCILPLLAAVEASHGPGGGLGHLWSRPTPVRRPRRSATASAAVVAGAEPRTQLHRLEPAHRPTIRGKCALGWVCRPSLWVWWSSLVGGSISLLGLCLFGSSVRAGALGFVAETGFCPRTSSLFASGGQSAAVFVRVCQHDSFVESTSCSLVPFSRSISIWLA